MRNHWLLVVSGLLLAAPSSQSFAADPTLDGLWRSSAGAVYRYVQRGKTVVATYEVLNEGQIAAGIKKGDLSLKGTYVDNVLMATFYQRAPVAIQQLCPEHQVIDLPVAWELKDDILRGGLVLVYGSSDSCDITRMQLQDFRLEREPAESADVPQPAGQMSLTNWAPSW